MRRRERLCGAFVMFGAVILTFVITALSMLVLFLLDGRKKQDASHKYMLKENGDLRRQISELHNRDQRRRENSAYDRGLYDGRTTDAYYRQCLRKFTSREQTDVILNGEQEEKR